MIEIFRKYKKWIIIIAVLIVAFIIYSYWTGGKTNNNVLTATGGNTTGAGTLSKNPQVGQAFLNQLLTLQNVSLNPALFSDPRFQSLQDFSQPIPDEPQGRPNPFAPIGVDVSNGPTINNSGPGTVNFTIQSVGPTKSSTSTSPNAGR